MTEENLIPWLTVFLSPKKTINSLKSKPSIFYLFLPAILFGAAQVFIHSIIEAKFSFSFIKVFIKAILIGPLLGVLLPSIFALGLNFTWFAKDYKRSFNNTFLVIVWADMPNVLSFSLWIIFALQVSFKNLFPVGILDLQANAFLAISFFLFAYSCVLKVIFLSEMYRMAILDAIFNYLLFGLTLIFPFFIYVSEILLLSIKLF